MSTLGADPEVCVVNDQGEVVPAGACFDVWSQTMDIILPPEPEPDMPPKGRKLALGRPGFYLYEDGASLEMNYPPTNSPDEMVDTVGYSLAEAHRLVEAAGYHIEIRASLPITEEVIQRGGVALSRFGCDPDRTLYNDRYDPSRIDARTCYNRFYGGHIHIGLPEGVERDFFEDYEWEMGVTCDILLGLTNVLFDHSQEAKTRRLVYGRIGRHRLQFYKEGGRGYEYRVPSNSWMRSPTECKFMFDIAQLVGYIIVRPELYADLTNRIDLDSLVRIINETDEEGARLMYIDAVLPFFLGLAEYNLEVASLGINFLLPLGDQPTDWKAGWGIE